MLNGNHESLNVAGDFRCAMDCRQLATSCAPLLMAISILSA